MSATLAKSSAVRRVRSLARRCGFSERRFKVMPVSSAGRCELWLRRRVGWHDGNSPPVRSARLLLGVGKSWLAATAAANWTLTANAMEAP